MRTIGVVTGSRSDYGICLPLLRRIHQDPDLCLHLLVTGMHLSPAFGMTVHEIEQDGFDIAERIEMLLSSDTPQGVAKSMGLGTIGFAQSFARFRPDLLVVLGDRFEMYAAAVAALPFKIPLAHLHGGESSEGAIDEALRHALTKMSHLHFVSIDYYARRVIQMGEEPWRVVVSGAPSLDNMHSMRLLSSETLRERYGLALHDAPLVVTYHPVTLEYEQTETQMRALLDALEAMHCSIVFTYPNADTYSRSIIDMIQAFEARHPQAQIATNLGTQGYFSLLHHAAAMVGNSSSGIIEAASFKLPVVNIGNRQRGRMQAKNVIQVGYSAAEIQAGITKAVSADFRASLENLINPYGDGHAAEMIVDRLKHTALDEHLSMKHFYDLEGDACLAVGHV